MPDLDNAVNQYRFYRSMWYLARTYKNPKVLFYFSMACKWRKIVNNLRNDWRKEFGE